MADRTETLMSTEEVAAATGLTLRQVGLRIRNGLVSPTKVGARYVWTADDLADLHRCANPRPTKGDES